MPTLTVDLTRLPDITNDVYFPYYEDDSRFLVLVGGSGSGKSIFAVQKILFRIITENRHRFLACRKYAASLRRSSVQLFLDVAESFGISRYLEFSKTDFSIRFPVFRSEILFTGLDDTEKLKSIVGITGAWVEEASEAEPGDLKELNRRLRGETPGYKQILLSFNPVAASAWIKRDYIDTARATVLKTTYRDNRFIDDEYIAELLAESDPYHRAVYTDGDFAELKGLVFPNTVFGKFSCVEADFREVLAGLDFGYNDPSALCKCAVRDGELYVLDEFYQRGLTNRDLIGALRGVLDPKRTVIADSAEPDRIMEFNRDGFRVVGARKGRDSIKVGIDFLRRFKAIRVDPHRTPNIARELAEYRYAESKDGIVQELPVPKNDHAIDALRYAVEPLWKSREIRTAGNVAAALGIY